MTAATVNDISALVADFPAELRDVKLNLKNLAKGVKLTPAQAWGVALAVAYNEGFTPLIEAVTASGREQGGLEEAQIADAKVAAALMSMNNVYYRFRHIAARPDYAQMPARLRMTRMAKLAGPEEDFELFSLAVSAVNNCEYCVKAHEDKLLGQGVGVEAIHDAVRIAAIVRSAAVSLKIIN